MRRRAQEVLLELIHEQACHSVADLAEGIGGSANGSWDGAVREQKLLALRVQSMVVLITDMMEHADDEDDGYESDSAGGHGGGGSFSSAPSASEEEGLLLRVLLPLYRLVAAEVFEANVHRLVELCVSRDRRRRGRSDSARDSRDETKSQLSLSLVQKAICRLLGMQVHTYAERVHTYAGGASGEERSRGGVVGVHGRSFSEVALQCHTRVALLDLLHQLFRLAEAHELLVLLAPLLRHVINCVHHSRSRTSHFQLAEQALAFLQEPMLVRTLALETSATKRLKSSGRTATTRARALSARALASVVPPQEVRSLRIAVVSAAQAAHEEHGHGPARRISKLATTVIQSYGGLVESSTSDTAVASTTASSIEEESPAAGAGAGSTGWIESVDPTSGNVYYFNQQTNETTWDRPAEFDAQSSTPEPMLTLAPAPVLAHVLAHVLALAPTATPEPAAAAAPAPAPALASTSKEAESAVWQAMVDEQNGSPYYYNTQTGESRWEKPEAQEAPVEKSRRRKSLLMLVSGEAHVPTAVSTIEVASGALVWKEIVDETHGLYFYNTQTGESRWEKPADAQAASVAVAAGGLGDEKVAGWIKADGGGATAAAVKLGEWTKIEDATNGNYYYNTVTGETSWSPPTNPMVGGSAGDVVEAAGAGDAHAVEGSGARTAEGGVADPLQHGSSSTSVETQSASAKVAGGWRRIVNEVSGVYYFNDFTGESQWDEPTEYAEYAEYACVLAVEEKTEEEEVLPLMSSASETDSDVPTDTDTDSDTDQLATDAANRNAADIPATGGQSHSGEKNAPVLYRVSGGKAQKAKAQKAKAQKAQGEDPAKLLEQALLESNGIATDGATDTTTRSSSSSSSSSNSSDTGPWKELVDETQGIYYYNSATGESSWEKPADVPAARTNMNTCNGDVGAGCTHQYEHL
jgi:hypothetical protein